MKIRFWQTPPPPPHKKKIWDILFQKSDVYRCVTHERFSKISKWFIARECSIQHNETYFRSIHKCCSYLLGVIVNVSNVSLNLIPEGNCNRTQLLNWWPQQVEIDQYKDVYINWKISIFHWLIIFTLEYNFSQTVMFRKTTNRRRVFFVQHNIANWFSYVKNLIIFAGICCDWVEIWLNEGKRKTIC